MNGHDLALLWTLSIANSLFIALTWQSLRNTQRMINHHRANTRHKPKL